VFRPEKFLLKARELPGSPHKGYEFPMWVQIKLSILTVCKNSLLLHSGVFENFPLQTLSLLSCGQPDDMRETVHLYRTGLVPLLYAGSPERGQWVA
jgi:hypothetical protein